MENLYDHLMIYANKVMELNFEEKLEFLTEIEDDIKEDLVTTWNGIKSSVSIIIDPKYRLDTYPENVVSSLKRVISNFKTFFEIVLTNSYNIDAINMSLLSLMVSVPKFVNLLTFQGTYFYFFH